MSGETDVARATRNLADSLARLKQTTASYGRGRLDELRTSADAEVRRRVTVLVCACAALVLLYFAVLFAGVAVIIAFHQTHPALAAGGVALAFLLLAGLSVWLMARAHRRRTPAAGWVMSLLATVLQVRRAMR